MCYGICMDLRSVLGNWWNCCIGSESMRSQSSVISKRRSAPVLRCKPMKPAGEKMASTATSGVSRLRRSGIYEYHHSRAGEVVKQLIGEDFQGVLGSDFY